MYVGIECPNAATAHKLMLYLNSIGVYRHIETKSTNHFMIESTKIDEVSSSLDEMRTDDSKMRYMLQYEKCRIYINKKGQRKQTKCTRKCISL